MSDEKESITFGLVNNDLLKKYFIDDSEGQLKDSATDLIDDTSSKDSFMNKLNDEFVQESPLNFLSVVSNDAGYNPNTDNQNKSTPVNISQKKSTEKLKTDFEITNKRKRRTIPCDIEDGEIPSKHCKVRDGLRSPIKAQNQRNL